MAESIKIRLDQIWIVNFGERRSPKYKAFILASDSLLLSTHEVSMTNKDMFGSFWVSSKRCQNGLDKFRKAFFSYLFDSNSAWEDFNKALVSCGERGKEDEVGGLILSLDSPKFKRVKFSELSEIKYRYNFFNNERRITMTIRNNPLFQKLSFVVCVLTAWGVRDDLARGAKEIYNKIKQEIQNVSPGDRGAF
jgi:hypothetical protein